MRHFSSPYTSHCLLNPWFLWDYAELALALAIPFLLSPASPWQLQVPKSLLAGLVAGASPPPSIAGG